GLGTPRKSRDTGLSHRFPPRAIGTGSGNAHPIGSAALARKSVVVTSHDRGAKTRPSPPPIIGAPVMPPPHWDESAAGNPPASAEMPSAHTRLSLCWSACAAPLCATV